MTDESARFATHREPVWRDRANFIVNAVVPGTEVPLLQMEQLWTRKLGDDKFEICCIPFFLYDIALGDVVRTHPQLGRRYVVDRTVVPSGRYVFRVWFGEASDPCRADVAARLKNMGALLEWSSRNLLAVDASSPDHAQQIAGYLQEQESRGGLTYETGKSHPET